MQNINLLDRMDAIRFGFFNWRAKTNIGYKILLIAGMACFSGLLAQLKFYLPFTPVPVTGQTFAAALSGVMLGSIWGGLSQVLYILLGLAGIPWFAGAKAGLTVLAGPTGGYLIGFVLESLFLGYIIDNYVKSRKFYIIALLIMSADYFLIFGCGIIQLNLWYNIALGRNLAFYELLVRGLFPFIPGEIVKMLFAASLITIAIPKKDYK